MDTHTQGFHWEKKKKLVHPDLAVGGQKPMS